MSNVLQYDHESGTTSHLWALTYDGISAWDAAKIFAHVPNGGSVRSLQAAANPDNPNLSDKPTLRKHADEIRYEREEITMGEARNDFDLEAYVRSDDEFDADNPEKEFDDDSVLLVRHNWYVPSNLTQFR